MSDSRSTPATPDNDVTYGLYFDKNGQILILDITFKEGGGVSLTHPENIANWIGKRPWLAEMVRLAKLEFINQFAQQAQEEMKQQADAQHETDSGYDADETSSEYSHVSVDGFSSNTSLRSSLDSITSNFSDENIVRLAPSKWARDQIELAKDGVKAVKDQAAFDRNRMFSQQPKQQHQHQSQHHPIHQPRQFGR